MQGRAVQPITELDKERFLELYAAGHDRPTAAEACNLSARRVRALCSPNSESYDPDFAERYQALRDEHDQARRERLEAALFERAVKNSDRLGEKFMTVLHPDWQIFKPSQLQSVNVQQLTVILDRLPTELLEQVVQELEKQTPALPAAETIEGEAVEETA